MARVKYLPVASILALLLVARAFTESTQLVLENDRVRVLRVVLPRHEKASVDWQPEFVTIYLTDAHEKITAVNGNVREVRGKAGSTSHSMAAARIAENLSDQPLEFVVVELKKKPPGSPTYRFLPQPIRQRSIRNFTPWILKTIESGYFEPCSSRTSKPRCTRTRITLWFT